MKIEKCQLMIGDKYVDIPAPPVSVLKNMVDLERVPHPFYGLNEDQARRTCRKERRLRLVFSGPGLERNRLRLRTSPLADIYVNGDFKSRIDNAFREYTVDYDCQGKNELIIVYHPPEPEAAKAADRYGALFSAMNSIRPYIRRPQFMYGWDWGPVLPDFLLYSLEDCSFERAFLERYRFRTLEANEKKAVVEISLDFIAEKDVSGLIKFYGRKKKFNIGPRHSQVCWRLEIDSPRLWWPSGYGEPTLHDLEIQYEDGPQLRKIIRKVGIKEVKLFSKDEFTFAINGRKVFARGYNWIPSHSFLSLNDEPGRIKELFDGVVESNANMLRVWGGGLYESEGFYDEAAKRGIMVWQDFAFCCAEYPEHDAFIEEVEKEAAEQVNRIGNYPALVLFCGNNENEWIFQRQGARPMKGAKLFAHVLPDAVREYAPEIPYWRSSPWGDPKDPNGDGQGDIHIWHFWHELKNYDVFNEFHSPFVSEFGMQSLPGEKALDMIFDGVKERRAFSEALEARNKHPDGQQRIGYYLERNGFSYQSFSEYRELTQIFQGLVLKQAIEWFRVNGSMGALIWQLNDCWPVVSWSVIDFTGERKLSWYLVKASFQDRIVTMNKGRLFLHSFYEGHFKIDLEIMDCKGETVFAEERKIDCQEGRSQEISLPLMPEGASYVRISAPDYINYVFLDSCLPETRLVLLKEIVDFYKMN